MIAADPNSKFPHNFGPLLNKIRFIHNSGINLTVMVSGGAVEALSKLTAIPGASQIFAEGIVPYAAESMTNYAGPIRKSEFRNGVKIGGGAVTQETAIQMAHAAWIRSNEVDSSRPAFGLGITASLATKVPHRAGDHAWIAIQSGVSGENIYTAQLKFVLPMFFGAEGRESQSQIVGATALWMLADHIAKPAPLNLDSEWYSWLANVREAIGYEIGAQRPICPSWPYPIVPGSSNKGIVFGKDGQVHRAEDFLHRDKHYILGGRFSPVHWGHFSVKRYLDRATKKVGLFNATRNHPRKGPLSDDAIVALLQACQGKVDVLLDEDTQLFVDKARRWGIDIAMGLDAFNLLYRMNPGDVDKCAKAGSILHVTNRPDTPVQWEAIGEAMKTGAVRYYTEGCWPVSSTELRAKAKRESAR